MHGHARAAAHADAVQQRDVRLLQLAQAVVQLVLLPEKPAGARPGLGGRRCAGKRAAAAQTSRRAPEPRPASRRALSGAEHTHMVCRISAVAVAARVHRRGSARSLAGRAGTGGGPQALGAACLAAASCSPRMMCCTMPFTSPPAQNAFSPAPLRMMQCTFALASQSCTVRAGFTTQCSARGSACQALPVGGALALYSLCSVSDIVKFRAFSALGLPHAAPLSSIPHTVQLLNRKAGAALPTVATPRASRAPCLFSVATAAAGPTSYSTCGQHALSAQRSCKQQRAMTRRRVHEGPPPALAWSLRSRGTSSCSGCGQQSAPRTGGSKPAGTAGGCRRALRRGW